MINCIIIEDQLPAQRILKKYIEAIPELDLKGTFTNVISAEASLNNDLGLIFLDIHLPKISGIDFLKSLNNPPQVILTTAFSDYALEGFDLNVTDYLLKPFSFERFKKAIDKVQERIILKSSAKQLESTEIFIKSGHDHFKIDSNELLFINADADYTDLHTSDMKYISAESLKYWEEKLENYNFIRVHRSFIINTKKIIKTSSRKLLLKGNHEIPIGRTYKNKVVPYLTQQS